MSVRHLIELESKLAKLVDVSKMYKKMFLIAKVSGKKVNSCKTKKVMSKAHQQSNLPCCEKDG